MEDGAKNYDHYYCFFLRSYTLHTITKLKTNIIIAQQKKYFLLVSNNIMYNAKRNFLYDYYVIFQVFSSLLYSPPKTRHVSQPGVSACNVVIIIIRKYISYILKQGMEMDKKQPIKGENNE